ncbi:glycoside hydrolase family 43 protein [Robertkochia solimangrovi]|uniref:glycoside hydrolase family 43 protein n=1 Tax=Robertkochia solimangrovi TaxID=2213046 RepID=UPI00117ED547|nr:glycoside hydrolase family 43 protein [Robertkochia solimangrovi]TRZ42937.1 beta-xylosidase [Robertkochia solimangrovi]
MKDLKQTIFIFFAFLVISCASDSSGNQDEQFPEEAGSEHLYLADPTMLNYNGIYYLYGTSQGNLEKYGKGFLVFTSEDLTEWNGPAGNADGFALREASAFGTDGFWAPQVFRYNNVFYMAYTANEKIALATSTSPLGPFTNSGTPIDNTISQIDPFIFFDDDGKKYLYHVRFENGNKIFVAELNEDLQSIKEETLTEVLAAEEPWENTAGSEWPVAEGPTVFKRDNTYYLLYSANDFRNPDYAVGYATSMSPYGPWTKAENDPIIHGDKIGESGTGHGDLFWDNDMNMHYVLHTHYSKNSVFPRISGIVEIELNSDGITVKDESFLPLNRIIN